MGVGVGVRGRKVVEAGADEVLLEAVVGLRRARIAAILFAVVTWISPRCEMSMLLASGSLK